MPDNVELKGVPDTLFIPLAARVEVSKRFPDYFYDKKSLELEHLDAVKKVAASSSEYSVIASAARYYNMDRIASEFIRKNGNAAVIVLGAGLETMSFRFDGDSVPFYCVDFSDVIESRERLLGNAENETLIGCDITDLSWTEQIDSSKSVLMVVSGVFQYFQPEQVHELLAALKGVFPGSEMVFDSTDPVGIKYARKHVKKTGNMDAMMYFCISDPSQFAQDENVELLGVTGFYADARKMLKGRVGLYTRIAMKVADDKDRTMILHIKL